MNILGSLPQIVKSKKKRLGRGYGSGAGAKSGRGTTRHQAARETIKIDYEGGQNKLTKKFPLLRGKTRNKSVFLKLYPVSVDKLNSLSAKEEVTIETLLKSKIITKKNAQKGVKIVGGKKLTQAYIVKLPTTESAKKLIEAAKGTIE